ncbi:MAG: tetratricopeptide repeat protein [Bryobacteraceae bacterium]
MELSHRGRFPEASAKFVEALALDPSLAEAHYLLGLVRQQEGRGAAAIQSFQAALRINPRYAEAHARVCELETANARSRESGYDKALDACRRAIALDANDPEPHFHSGWLQSKLGAFPAAIREFQTVLRIDPKFRNARFELAMAFADSQDFAHALPLLKDVVAAEPSNGNAQFQLGSVLAKQGDCTSAVPYLEAATEAAQKYYLLATCYKKLEREADSAAAFAKVKQLRDGADARMQAKYRAAVAHQKAEAGKLDEAIAEYRAALQLSPDPSVAVDLAVALLRKGDAAAVVKLLEGREDPLALYQVALAQAKLGTPEASRSALERALAARPSFAEARYQLGVTLLAMGRAAEAERELAAVVSTRPDEPAFRSAWADALDKLGRAAEARAQRQFAARLPK